MDDRLIGKCGFYCGACPTFLCGECADFPCDTILTRPRVTVLDPAWLEWKKRSRH